MQSDRLTLRQPVDNDAGAVFALRSDLEINKYLDRPPDKTIDDARTFINKINENSRNNVSVYWAICPKGSNLLIGTICLFGFLEKKRNCEIGFELSTNFQGQGLMQEAAGKVIQYAIDIGVDEIEAWVHKDNRRSIRSLEKLSFKNCDHPDSTDTALIHYRLQELANIN